MQPVKKIEEMTLEEIADWVCKTCLMFGTSPATAYKVAGTFVAGLEKQNDTRRTTQDSQNPG